jgi:hypothetical protein
MVVTCARGERNGRNEHRVSQRIRDRHSEKVEKTFFFYKSKM